MIEHKSHPPGEMLEEFKTKFLKIKCWCLAIARLVTRSCAFVNELVPTLLFGCLIVGMCSMMGVLTL